MNGIFRKFKKLRRALAIPITLICTALLAGILGQVFEVGYEYGFFSAPLKVHIGRLIALFVIICFFFGCSQLLMSSDESED